MLSSLPLPKFVYKDGKSGVTNANYWWSESRRRQIPFIGVRREPRYAEIWFDYLTLDPKLDKMLRANEIIVIQGLREIFEKFGGAMSKFSCRSALIPCFEKIPLQHAQACAEELFDFLCKFLGLGEFSKRAAMLERDGEAFVALTAC